MNDTREAPPFFTATDRDFVDDWCQENGQYMHECAKCEKTYVAHKHRMPRLLF